ncbi:MAG TPA: hypothetical protein VGC59_15855 [Solirubrobacteraceae bacterium]
MSAQPPEPGQPQVPDRATIRCPRCSSPVGPDQDWCLECGAPARTRLAPTPNWQLPTVALGAIVAIAGALLAFAFVKLTNDNGNGNAAVGTPPSAVVETATPTATVPPAATSTVATATTTAPAGPAVPSTVPGQTAPAPAAPTQASTTKRRASTPTTPSGTTATTP